ncbi:MAG: type II toxin-antitoxin system VapC family toxin, partial [Vicinamibacterales bacterium]
MAFWDASAIVPLCCSQPATAQGRRLRRDLKRMVVWWGTPLEARSAFARLVREGQLTAEERVTAVRLLGQLRVAWDEILAT